MKQIIAQLEDFISDLRTDLKFNLSGSLEETIDAETKLHLAISALANLKHINTI